MSADGSAVPKTGGARLLEIADEAERSQTPLHLLDVSPTILALTAESAQRHGVSRARPDARSLRSQARTIGPFATHETEGGYYKAMVARLEEAAGILEAGCV